MAGTITDHADACGISTREFIEFVVMIKGHVSPGRFNKVHVDWVHAHSPQESARRHTAYKKRINQKRRPHLKFIGQAVPA